MRGLLMIVGVLTVILSVVVLATVKPQPAEEPATQKVAAQTTEPAPAEAHGDHAAMFENARVHDAICILQSTAGHTATGTVRFKETEDGLKIHATIHGLEPQSSHGFHIHAFGDLSAADGTSAGGHYNPEGHDHALPSSQLARHAGDLGNVTANDDGSAKFSFTATDLTINGPVNPVLGRGMILHAKPDDGGQPTGNAGARIAMGVIGVSETKAPAPAEPQAEPEAEEVEEEAASETNAAPAAPRN